MKHSLQKQSMSIPPTMRSENGIRDGGKRSPLKLDKDMVLAEKIKDLIADKNYGIYVVIQTFTNNS